MDHWRLVGWLGLSWKVCQQWARALFSNAHMVNKNGKSYFVATKTILPDQKSSGSITNPDDSGPEER
jgi:hypothetical protein